MTSLTSRIQALRDVCEGVIAASDRATKGPWKVDPVEDADGGIYIQSSASPATPAIGIAFDNVREYDGNAHFIALSRTLTPQFARATLKTLDWLEADMKEGDPLALAYELHRNRIESILSEFGI